MRWDTFLKKTANGKVRSLLEQNIGHGGTALDLGPGSLNDVKFLLDNGYEVDAVDSSVEVSNLARLLPISFYPVTFADYSFPKEKYDLINAQFSLPFHGKQDFSELMKRVRNSLKHKGVFVGQFFGPEDDWKKTKPAIAFHTRKEVEDFFPGYELSITESKRSGTTAAGSVKFWHIFHVVAKKP